MKIQFVEIEKPKPYRPVFVCGLPGSAFVGKFALDHLVEDLSAKLFAEIYNDAFPPEIMIKEDGTASLIKNELHYSRGDQRPDIILFTGESQPSTPEGNYALSEYLVDLAVGYGAKELVTLGAYVTGTFVESPKVFAVATDQETVSRLENSGCSIMTDGLITGMNGLLLGMAKLKGLSGFTLLGETSGLVFDPKASGAVLQSLSKLLGIPLDIKKLDQRARDAQEVMSAIEDLKNKDFQERGSRPDKKRLDYIS
ncbi:MAG: PAC2 family protein [Thaumarchaeota archaeon]|nr:PAC2 family protein [Nitrososphaerota archaeon]